MGFRPIFGWSTIAFSLSIGMRFVANLTPIAVAIYSPCLADEDAASARVPEAKRINETEGRAFAAEVIDAIQQADYGRYGDLVRWDTILERVSELPKSKSLDNARNRFRNPRAADQIALRRYV